MLDPEWCVSLMSSLFIAHDRTWRLFFGDRDPSSHNNDCGSCGGFLDQFERIIARRQVADGHPDKVMIDVTACEDCPRGAGLLASGLSSSRVEHPACRPRTASTGTTRILPKVFRLHPQAHYASGISIARSSKPRDGVPLFRQTASAHTGNRPSDSGEDG